MAGNDLRYYAQEVMNGRVVQGPNAGYAIIPRPKVFKACIHWDGQLSQIIRTHIQKALPELGDHIKTEYAGDVIVATYPDEATCNLVVGFFHDLLYEGVKFSAIKTEAYAGP